MEPAASHKYLFGGPILWNPKIWRASDDTVRGGSSHSSLVTQTNSAFFSGTLDTTTLGGAGFTSQQTTNDLNLDLSKYEGISLKYRALVPADFEAKGIKKYTLLLKDEIPDKRHDGRERSAVCWEVDFEPRLREEGEGGDAVTTVHFKWRDFRATYRGKDLPDHDQRKGLNTASVKRVGIMVRSFFDEQSGGFELEIKSIAAYREDSENTRYRDEPVDYTSTDYKLGNEVNMSGLDENKRDGATASHHERYRDEPEQMSYNNRSDGFGPNGVNEKLTVIGNRQQEMYQYDPSDEELADLIAFDMRACKAGCASRCFLVALMVVEDCFSCELW
ncbi:complex I intermediate-associated protein 30-domain-containing protein [Aspergillus heterothallicus]